LFAVSNARHAAIKVDNRFSFNKTSVPMTTAALSQPANGIVESPNPSRGRLWLLGLLLIIAAAIRIYGAFNDLWLDEIWSLQSVGAISAPWQVFTKLHYDNNNYLNSLWLYWCGFRGNWPGYRIPSLVAGIGSVVLAGMIGRRRDARAAVFATLLFAFSYVQILYSSEARGYAEAVFFSFLSFYALDKYLEKQAWQSALLFSVSSILGFASHLIFLNFFGAAVLWSGWRLIKSGFGTGRAIETMLACHAAPAAFLIAVYFIDIRHQVFGGGTKNGPGVYVDSFAWALGGPPGHLSMTFTFLLAVALFIAGLWLLRRENSDLWIFFMDVILAVPILLAFVRHSEVLYVRHFIIGMAFFLILFSFVLATLYQCGWRGRTICMLLLAGYFIINGWQTLSLFKYGRGQYSAAARFLAEHTKGPVVTVGGDHDFRVGLVWEFHAKETMGNKTAKYCRVDSWPKGGAEWFIGHMESFEAPTPPITQFTDGDGNAYEFVKSFPTAPLSGLHWFVYHNKAYNAVN
jgi:hypothetical protein